MAAGQHTTRRALFGTAFALATISQQGGFSAGTVNNYGAPSPTIQVVRPLEVKIQPDGRYEWRETIRIVSDYAPSNIGISVKGHDVTQVEMPKSTQMSTCGMRANDGTGSALIATVQPGDHEIVFSTGDADQPDVRYGLNVPKPAGCPAD